MEGGENRGRKEGREEVKKQEMEVKEKDGHEGSRRRATRSKW